MSLDSQTEKAVPVRNVGELVAYLRSAEKPSHQFRIGLEHEKFLYSFPQAQPVPYEGTNGIQALFARLAARGWEEVRETPTSPVIALKRHDEVISLEPGGQVELSGSPFVTAREAHAQNVQHIQELNEVLGPTGHRLVALGYRPFDALESMPWMPKSRYRIMRQTLGAQGRLALNMMLMTATGQVSLDFGDEADCARKVELISRMSPFLVAMFANSPLLNGQPSGMLSFRSHVWTDVDAARCGYLPFMLNGSFTYQAYVEWALDVPMLFLRRSGQYLNPSMTFRHLLERGYDGQPAFLSDWVDHLSTLFPEVRVKRLIEIRAADGVSLPLTGALPALARGLLYDRSALDEALLCLPKLSLNEHLQLAHLARVEGLRGEWKSTPLWQWAKELLSIARAGLTRLDALDAPLLEPLEAQVESHRSPAERVLELFQQKKSVPELLEAFSL